MTAQLIFQYSCIYNFRKRRGAVMIVYMDLENLLKENKNYSEIKTIQDFSGNDRCVIAKVGKI